jgi:signal transduction histidine kinase
MISTNARSITSLAFTRNPQTRLVGVSLIDAQGLYLYVDQVYAHLWDSRDPADLQGTSVAQYFLDPSAIASLISHADHYGFSIGQIEAVRSDGSIFALTLRIELLTVKQTTLYLCNACENTDHRADQMLERSLDTSEFGAQLPPNGIFLLVPDRIYGLEIGFASSQIKELCGISTQELQQGSISFLRRVVPHDRTRLLERLKSHQHHLESVCVQFRYLHPIKGLIWLEAFLWPQEPGNRASNILSFVQDISTQVIDTIWHNLNQLENASDLIFTLDSDFRIRELNGAAQRVFAMFGDSLLGKELSTVFAYLDSGEPLQHIQQALQRDGYWKTELYQERGHALGLIFLLRRSSLVSFEASQQTSSPQLIVGPQTDGLMRFAGGFAHNVNNLLMIVLGYSELIQSQISPHETIYTDVQHIRTAGDQLRILIDQLLAFGGKQDLLPYPSNLHQLLTSLQHDLWANLPVGISLNYDLEPDLPFAYIDEAKLEYAIVELIKNASFAMGSNGKIDLSARRVQADDLAVYDLPPHIDETYILLRISDSGIGMDLETQRQAFEPFFTTKELGEGVGLGLAMVYGIIHQSGGAIMLESVPEKGTSVAIFLPSSIT